MWATSSVSSQFLYVEQDESLEWEASVARAFEEKIISKSQGAELIRLFAKDCPRRSDLRSWLARSFLDQLLGLHPELFHELDRAQQGIQQEPVDDWQARQSSWDGQVIPWKESLRSPQPAWQHLWCLLGCILGAPEKARDTAKQSAEINKTQATDTSQFVIMLFGCEGQTYQALNYGLKYVASIRPSFKFLIIGKPLPEDLTGNSETLRHEQVSARIWEETEILGSLTESFLHHVANSRKTVLHPFTSPSCTLDEIELKNRKMVRISGYGRILYIQDGTNRSLASCGYTGNPEVESPPLRQP
jgi:hypothetical protein